MPSFVDAFGRSSVFSDAELISPSMLFLCLEIENWPVFQAWGGGRGVLLFTLGSEHPKVLGTAKMRSRSTPELGEAPVMILAQGFRDRASQISSLCFGAGLFSSQGPVRSLGREHNGDLYPLKSKACGSSHPKLPGQLPAPASVPYREPHPETSYTLWNV